MAPGYVTTRVKWLISKRLRHSTRRCFVSSVRRWTTLGIEFRPNHLNAGAHAARTVLAQHIFAMAKKGERDPELLIEGALMRLTL